MSNSNSKDRMTYFKDWIVYILAIIIVAFLVILFLVNLIGISTLIPISASFVLITASLSTLVALNEYRLKVKTETRLTNSAEVEADIKLLKLFTEIMNIAHARGGSQVSEKAIEIILSQENITKSDLSDLDIVKIEKALRSAVINLPVGMAAQDAAICAIWALGKKHEILKPVAIQALLTLTGFKSDVASPYLEDLKSTYNDKLLATAYHQK